MMPRKILSILIILFLLPSCSRNKADSNVDSSSSTATESAAPKGITKFEGGYQMVKDEETGFMKPVSDKKTTPFANQQNQFKGKDGSFNKDFSTNNYDARRWNGADEKKSFLPWKKSKQKYDYSPQFIKDNADLAENTREKGKVFSRQKFSTASAKERGIAQIQKSSNDIVTKRREVYKSPPIISNQQYNSSGRSVEDVKGLLSE